MTDEDPAPETEHDDRLEDVHMPDSALELLVMNANEQADPDARMSITLAVGGLIVTGDVAAAWRWFELRGEGARPGSVVHEMAQRMVPVLKPDPNDDGDAPLPKYVHLTDARYVTPAGLIPTAEGMLWRGRIGRVDGWSLGSLGISEA